LSQLRPKGLGVSKKTPVHPLCPKTTCWVRPEIHTQFTTQDNITCRQLSTPVLEKAKATEGHDFVFQSRRYGTNTFRALNLIVVH
jgi:hypothetical protein